ncbi:MAG: helix-turn-helix transcriptional regulator [Chthoniobacteraceae bacterium]
MLDPVTARSAICKCLGVAIKRRREALKMTQEEVARAVKIGVRTLSEIEHGRQNATADMLDRIAFALELDYSELVIEAEALELAVA